jgi:hypothetical protein
MLRPSMEGSNRLITFFLKTKLSLTVNPILSRLSNIFGFPQLHLIQFRI